jgi:hypothetical protein
LRELTFTRSGNATDLATGTLYIYKDNGDRTFTAIDIVNELADDKFAGGVATLEFDTPQTIGSGSNLVIFLAVDLTIAGEDRTLGVTLDEDGINSTAMGLIGAFPINTLLTTISSEDDRGTQKTVNYDNGVIDGGWGQAREGSVRDGN